MRIQVTARRWDSTLQEFVVIPLDDADPDVIELARVLARDETQSVEQVMRRLGWRVDYHE